MRLGIHFGTYFSSAAFMNGNILTTLEDNIGMSYAIPSSIFVTLRGEVLVGRSADNRRSQYPDRYLREVKRVLGQSTPLLLGTDVFLPEQLVAHILMKIKRDADEQMEMLGKPAFTGAVLTIPVSYPKHKCDLMLKAATQAGFGQEELTLLEEPVAVALRYTHQSNIREGEILLVYDLGASTFDTALLQKRGDGFVYLALPAGIANRGGEDFDRVIRQDLLRQYPKLQEGPQSKVQHDLTAMNIYESSIMLKHMLSDSDEGGFSIIAATGDIFEYTLTRAAFQEMISLTIQKTIDCCQQMLQQARVENGQINRILLVGGNCRVPYIRQMLSNTFPCPIDAVPNLELVFCQGAALYTAQLEEPDPTKIQVVESVISKLDSKKTLEVFYSYSHEDEELMNSLVKHLSLFKRKGYITHWHDRKIDAGQEWANEINEHLNTADIILLLVSSDFLASDYCYGIEMKRALERHEAGDAIVLPIILRNVYWQGAPFGKLQVLPTGAKPVISRNWSDQDEAFSDIAEGFQKVLERMRNPV